MEDIDHDQTQEVDYLLGSALCIRRSVFQDLQGFDPKLFMYFEDQDLCRRCWKAGWKVVYHPQASMVHYHRRETAVGGLFAQLTNPLTRIQLHSAWHYFRKFHGEAHPRPSSYDPHPPVS
jgi:hypothetical protein